MIALIRLLLALLLAPFRRKLSLEAENSALRQQIVVLRRKLRGRVKLSNSDRLFFVWLYRLFPSISRTMLIIRPGTLVRWHRAGFRCYWRYLPPAVLAQTRPVYAYRLSRTLKSGHAKQMVRYRIPLPTVRALPAIGGSCATSDAETH